MFSRWGSFVYRFRRLIVLVTLGLATVSFIFAGQASSQLSSGGWIDPDSDSKRVEERIAAEFGGGNSSLVVLYRLPPGGDASDAQSQEQIASSLRPLRGDPRVAEIIGYAETRDARFLSEDGSATYALAQLDLTDDESVDQVDSLRALIEEPEGMTVQLTGYAPLTRDSTELSEQDLQRAELFSMPFAILILVAVFASIVAAGMPLLVAGLAIPTTLAFIYFGGQTFELSIYTINVSTMLGLALAIDYSLFLVSRFREELARGREVSEAVQRSVATSGKAVVFSGLAVAIGLSGLLFFESSAIRSFGIGGAVVVGSSVFYALTFLPALLGMLGHRVNALSVANLVGGLRRLIGIRPSGMTEAPVRPGWWERVAHGVMERPFLVLLPVLAFLLLAGSPFLRLEQG
ncbi:MAG: MMPL family transporter, partial [Candidatus Limnocylindrales bacterium]